MLPSNLWRRAVQAWEKKGPELRSLQRSPQPCAAAAASHPARPVPLGLQPAHSPSCTALAPRTLLSGEREGQPLLQQ